MKYRITLVDDPEDISGDRYAVFCDDIDGCCSQGATREDAIANIRSAISEMLECMNEHGIKPRRAKPGETFDGAASVEHIEIEEHEEAFA